MTPVEFEKAGKKLFGKRWKTPLAKALGLHVVTVWRYATGRETIPHMVALAVRGLRPRKHGQKSPGQE